jgi:hypothetical protein
MTVAPFGGPVSEALEADLRSWVRKHGLVIWLDLDGHYMGVADPTRRCARER